MRREEDVRILSRVAASLTVLISLAACAGTQVTKQNPADNFTFKHRDFDLHYAWNASQIEQGVRIDGLIKNVRYPNIDDLEIKVSLLNKEHKVIADGVAFPVPQKVQVNDYRSFGMILKNAKLSGGDQLQFLVSYSASEGQTALSWVSSFLVKAATGAPIGVGEGSDDEW